MNGQTQRAPTITPFTWATLHAAPRYEFTVGTTAFRTNLVNSGLLAPAVSNYQAALPADKALYATLCTEVAGKWVYQQISFSTSSSLAQGR